MIDSNNKNAIAYPHVLELSARRISSVFSDAPELVLIHGWCLSSSVWDSFIPLLSDYFNLTLIDLPGYAGSDFFEGCYKDDVLLPAMSAVLPDQSVICGWSLGANIALKVAEKYPRKCLGVVSLASNPCFVESNDWPGVSKETAEFSIERSLHDGEKYFSKFMGLCATSSSLDKLIWMDLKRCFSNDKTAQPALLESLRLVNSIDNRAILKKIKAPQCFVLAANDVISPETLAKKLSQHTARSKIHIVNDASHAVFLSQPEKVATHIRDFYKNNILKSECDKSLVAASFNASAKTYDAAADLQRLASDVLLKKLQATSLEMKSSEVARNIQPPECDIQSGASINHKVLDLASGTGYALPELKKLFKHSSFFASDIAPNMLKTARKRNDDVFYVQSDFDNIPFQDETFDLIFSNMGLQWSDDLRNSFQHIQRILKPDGTFVFSTFLPGTLKELRNAWSIVDPGIVHVNDFLTKEEIELKLNGAQFAALDTSVKTYQRYYSSVLELMKELKFLGAHNVNKSRFKGLTGKQKFLNLNDEYEQYKTDKGYAASYEVLYVVVKKPIR